MFIESYLYVLNPVYNLNQPCFLQNHAHRREFFDLCAEILQLSEYDLRP